MNITDFVDTPDLEKLIVVESKVGRMLQEETWTNHGVHGNVWYFSLSDDGEVVDVEEDGEAYTEKFSI